MRNERTRWNAWAVAAFELFFRPWMRRHLGGVHLAGLPRDIPSGNAVMLAANHVSWWDAFVLRELQRSCQPSAPLLTLMREEGLRRYPFFRWMGVVGIDDSPSGFRTALREVTSITDQPPWLSIFPQGRLWPSWRRPLEFKRSLTVFGRELAPAVVLPVGIHYEVMHKPQPFAFAHAGEPLRVEREALPDISEIEHSVDISLDRIYRFLAYYGEDAPERWPPTPFRALPEVPRTRSAQHHEA